MTAHLTSVVACHDRRAHFASCVCRWWGLRRTGPDSERHARDDGKSHEEANNGRGAR